MDATTFRKKKKLNHSIYTTFCLNVQKRSIWKLVHPYLHVCFCTLKMHPHKNWAKLTEKRPFMHSSQSSKFLPCSTARKSVKGQGAVQSALHPLFRCGRTLCFWPKRDTPPWQQHYAPQSWTWRTSMEKGILSGWGKGNSNWQNSAQESTQCLRPSCLCLLGSEIIIKKFLH